MNKDSILPLALAPDEAARYIGIGRTKLFEEIRHGRLPARKSGNRTLIEIDVLKAWLAAQPQRRVGASAEPSRRMKPLP
jgi:excisionase family DNA binding protein